MDEKKIARINELARKAKAEGLTDAEIEERAALRQEYLNAVMANARSVLENTYIVDEKGNKRKLRGKGEGEAGATNTTRTTVFSRSRRKRTITTWVRGYSSR